MPVNAERVCRCGGKAIPKSDLCICCGGKARQPCRLWARCCCKAAGNGHCYICGWLEAEHRLISHAEVPDAR